MPTPRARAGDPQARWHIVVTIERDGQDAHVLVFDHTPVTIGGAPTSDVVLGGPFVSRMHATVAVTAGHLVYRDQSSNGSLLNGKRVEEVQIDPTDVIVVSPYRLRFALEVGPDRFTILLPSDTAKGSVAANPGPLADEKATLLLDGAPRASAPLSRPSSFELHLIKAPDELSQRHYRFDRRFEQGDVIAVGRAPDAEILLDLQSVSRRHALFELAPGARWQVQDLGSRNGIVVNGRPVESAVLEDGDEIGFGPDVTAAFRQAPPAPADPPPAKLASDPEPPAAGQTLSTSSRRSALNGAVTVITVSGRIDGYNYAEFRDRLNRVIDNGERLLVLDFSYCPFCDHAGLGVVLSTKTALDKRNGALCLIGVNQMLSEGLALLGLRTMLAIEPDEASAVRRLVR